MGRPSTDLATNPRNPTAHISSHIWPAIAANNFILPLFMIFLLSIFLSLIRFIKKYSDIFDRKQIYYSNILIVGFNGINS